MCVNDKRRNSQITNLRGEGFFDGLALGGLVGWGLGLGVGLRVGLRFGASVVGHGTGILVSLLVGRREGEGDGSLVSRTGFKVGAGAETLEPSPSRFTEINSLK